MRAQRAQAPKVNPAPSGAVGDQYRPLSASQIDAIYALALRLLSELGMGEAPPELVESAKACGATVNELGGLCYSHPMVVDIIAGACKQFVLHGRDPDLRFAVGGNRTDFGTGGAAVQALDLDTGIYRPSTLADLKDFTRLVDTLDNVSWFTRCCVATDIPGRLPGSGRASTPQLISVRRWLKPTRHNHPRRLV